MLNLRLKHVTVEKRNILLDVVPSKVLWNYIYRTAKIVLIGLGEKKKVFTILRSPHIHKKSKEHYASVVYRGFIDVRPEVIEMLTENFFKRMITYVIYIYNLYYSRQCGIADKNVMPKLASGIYV